jgi:hypothetical protein
VVVPAVTGQQQVLEQGDGHRHRAEKHQQAQRPQPRTPEKIQCRRHQDWSIRIGRLPVLRPATSASRYAMTASK